MEFVLTSYRESDLLDPIGDLCWKLYEPDSNITIHFRHGGFDTAMIEMMVRIYEMTHAPANKS